MVIGPFHTFYQERHELYHVFFSSGSGTIIPLYVYPKTSTGGDAWQALYDAYRAHPIETWAIVNVYNGPGEPTGEPNYIPAIKKLHASGIKSLGYVKTLWGARPIAEIKAEIDLWKRLYQPHGIFFDEMANDNNQAHFQYYTEINAYAKQQGFSFTVGNPGTGTQPRYFETVDNIVVFETDTGFPQLNVICSQLSGNRGPETISIMPYNIPRLNETAVLEAKSCAGYIYVTNDGGSNPWDTLPPYLTKLFELLRR